MDIGSIFLLLALLVLVGLLISRPILERRNLKDNLSGDQDEHMLSTLMADRDRILNSLQELDFDYSLGKIPEEDYPKQRGYLLQRGADVFRQLDLLQNEASGETSEDRIEAVVAIRRVDAMPTNGYPSNGNRPFRGMSSANADPDDGIELLLAERRRTQQEKASGFCPKCGGPVHKSDRFCPKCGTSL
jgi:hypothetical protein